MEAIEEKKYLSEFKETMMGYHPVSTQAFSLIESIVQFQILKSDEILLREGQVARQIHFISKGAMIAYITNEDANTYNKNIFLDREFAGSTVSALLKKPSCFTLQAIEDSIIINIDYQKYKELIYRNDDLKNFYIAYLERNWIVDKERREISLVMENATERYQKLLKSHPGIDERIPLRHIAAHLGITPTQLSRIRKDLEKS